MTPAAAHQPQVLVLDFDGVLCDSLEECTLVAHMAHLGLPAEAFADPGLAGVPPQITADFRAARPFMRHLGHFIVPFVAPREDHDRASFAASFARLDGALVTAFVESATAVRREVRGTLEADWLARHRVEMRLAGLLRSAYIATARDRESVQRILGSHGAELDGSRVFASLPEKNPSLAAIAGRESVRPADVLLVDDSVENCIAARDAGFAAAWAAWGYGADGDQALAEARGIPALTASGLVDWIGQP